MQAKKIKNSEHQESDIKEILIEKLGEENVKIVDG